MNVAYNRVPVSEDTPLIHRGKKRKHVKVAAVISFLLLFGFLMSWIPYVLSGITNERQKWERELRQRRVAEQSRIDDWEQQLKARQYEGKVRQDKWDQRQRDIRLEDARKRAQERLREEKWQREEEEQQKLGLHWDVPVADSHCTAHNTREYWARLLNTVPYSYNWLKPCEDIPIVIHGRSIKTTRCYINPHVPGEVYGHWLVDFNEPSCSPFWDQFHDKGCTAEGSGRRRVEAHLTNIHDGEDRQKLCASAPHDFYGQHFDHPDSCSNWGDWGTWEINDSSC